MPGTVAGDVEPRTRFNDDGRENNKPKPKRGAAAKANSKKVYYCNVPPEHSTRRIAATKERARGVLWGRLRVPGRRGSGRETTELNGEGERRRDLARGCGLQSPRECPAGRLSGSTPKEAKTKSGNQGQNLVRVGSWELKVEREQSGQLGLRDLNYCYTMTILWRYPTHISRFLKARRIRCASRD